MALDTWDLEALMEGEPHFVGVYALDEIPRVLGSRKVPVKMIVNLDPGELKGSHWVALYRNPQGDGFYFDTFGLPPPPPIAWWFSQHTNHWRGLDRQIQSVNDKVSCGYICMRFLKELN